MNIIQIYKQFPTKQDCYKHLEKVRWDNKPVCPYCGSEKQSAMPKENRYHCISCRTSYSVTIGTVFQSTRLDFQKWFLMISLMLDAKKSMSSRQMARHLEINKDTAHLNMMKIRVAMSEQVGLFNGIVEADETLIGGKNKNRHRYKKISEGQGGHSEDKTAIFGLKERGGKVKVIKITDRKASTLRPIIDKEVAKGSTIMTDEHVAYRGLHKDYNHKSVKHGYGQYVDGETHTNTIENFWSLFKRGYIGQWHHITEKYLNLYLNEFTFRQNNRGNTQLFELTLQKALGV